MKGTNLHDQSPCCRSPERNQEGTRGLRRAVRGPRRSRQPECCVASDSGRARGIQERYCNKVRQRPGGPV
ncbi:hypothetical protein BN940_06061 [Castellaniella defragrans 65Phen]|uniref:Uncharacterized protein n=1 Tax=Castellaniella defragrans (strain DSM 12143 / CCUG 39792 / 65Phen) TaxID=1437824 RepID=W8X3C8_CASD6|nr:hypothetical protein BN940_06061 [Castellaniella defragrans 65Phen]